MGNILLLRSPTAPLGNLPSWRLAPGHFVPHVLPLQIIAPRAGLTTTNRYYKAYPGLLYRVPVGVLGGAWPFEYKLVVAPAGMTVGQHYGDTDYGIINWSNPTTSGSPYTCQLQVTDQEGSVATVTWTITVTTTGFLFVDAVNGSASPANGGTGTGTIANPFRSMNDWYAGTIGGTSSATKNDGTYNNQFVYYRAGSYQTMDCYGEYASNAPTLPNYTRCVIASKPKVHLAYPGETVNISTDGNGQSTGGLGGNLINDAGTDQAGFFHGINFNNITQLGGLQAIHITPPVTDFCAFECTFSNFVGIAGANPTHIMMDSSGSSSVLSQYNLVKNNTWLGADTAELVELYTAQYTVIEGNTISNSINGGDGGGFYFKQDCRDFSVRANTGLVGNNTSLFRYDNFSVWSAHLGEVCWNNYATSGKALEFGTFGNNWGTVGIYRNTWQCTHCDILTTNGVSGSGTINVSGDVTVGDGTQTNNWLLSTFIGTLTFSGYVTGTSANSIVDANGNLTGPYNTAYFGIAGHQVG